MIYLLILSFFLHLVSIFAIVTLYQKTEAFKPMDKEQTLREMEDLLVSYTTEMKENNERIARRLSKLNLEQAKPTNFEKESRDPTEEQKQGNQHPSEKPEKDADFVNKSSAASLKELNREQTNEKDEYGGYKPPSIPDDDVKVNTSSTSRILSMHAQGESPQEIARKLQMGAGEVELLLKFHQ
ncbi:DUF6115 domain-containing protein [Salisediminibacterium beveridgei]|uniref:Uncharacterized protein n=1 Tax=Salisediminibacterium beveridgei TaxID=632773 RepID=A0A1D7QW07_9BACI|nr:hypothetical protein [Salisediminibacterium beveridgei]AOM83158.1 hypothetical protein BBEV_1797 [Salisediminibacterium beveridgei]